MNSFNELWEMVKDECRSLVSESIYDVWFKDIELVSFDEEKVVLAVSGFKKKFVETRFIDKLKQAFYNIMGFDIDIEIREQSHQRHIRVVCCGSVKQICSRSRHCGCRKPRRSI